MKFCRVKEQNFTLLNLDHKGFWSATESRIYGDRILKLVSNKKNYRRSISDPRCLNKESIRTNNMKKT